MSFFHQQPNDTQFTVLMELGNQKIFIIKKMESDSFDFFFQTNLIKPMDQSINS